MVVIGFLVVISVVAVDFQHNKRFSKLFSLEQLHLVLH